MAVEQTHLFVCSLYPYCICRHYADYPVHVFKFTLSSEYIASIFCKRYFNGFCYVRHIRGKQVDKCFGIYSVFGFLDKQGYCICLASFNRLLDYLSIFPCFGLSFCFRLFVSVHIAQNVMLFYLYKDKIISGINKTRK